MGFYIETPSFRGKAEFLIANHRAQEVTNPFSLIIPAEKNMVPVVVVDNGLFEAAAICFSERERAEFTSPFDSRPKRYLWVPREEVIKLCPGVEQYLKGE